MKEEDKAKIEVVLKTLDTISVRGRDNIDMLLGCILALESVLKEEAKDDGKVLDGD